MSRSEHLISADELESSLRILDVRWHLSDAPGDGRRRYAQGHLPGARFLDLEAVLTAHTGNPRDGRHPLPDAATLAAGLEALGVAATDDIVVYDEPGSHAAERAWWVLRWAGLRARVLDGGIDAWTGPLEAGEPTAATPSQLHLTVGQLPTIDADEAAGFAWAGGVLVDGRAPERYRGETEPLDPRAGHIPGAVNVPATWLYDEGRMPSDDKLRSQLAVALDGEPGEVATYCGSGVSAARNVLALAVLGVEASLFPGSWSAWSNDPARIAALGPEPGGQTLDSQPWPAHILWTMVWTGRADPA